MFKSIALLFIVGLAHLLMALHFAVPHMQFLGGVFIGLGSLLLYTDIRQIQHDRKIHFRHYGRYQEK